MHRDIRFCVKYVRYNIFTDGAPYATAKSGPAPTTFETCRNVFISPNRKLLHTQHPMSYFFTCNRYCHLHFEGGMNIPCPLYGEEINS